MDDRPGVSKQRVPSFQTHKGCPLEKGLATYLSGPEAGCPHIAAGLGRPAGHEALGSRKQSCSIAGSFASKAHGAWEVTIEGRDPSALSEGHDDYDPIELKSLFRI